VAASRQVGWLASVLPTAYAIGAALPMLAIALGGRRVATRLRAGGSGLRLASGAVIGLVALGIAFHVDDRFTTALPGYTQTLQKHIEDTSTAQRQLAKLRGGKALVPTKNSTPGFPDYGAAPPLLPRARWFNSPPSPH